MLWVALIWGAGPILGYGLAASLGWTFDHQAHLVSTSLFSLLLFLAGRLNAETMRATEVNRRYVRAFRVIVVILFVAQIAQWQLGLDIRLALGVDQAMFGIFVALLGATLDPRLLVGAVPFALAVLVVFWHPDWFWLACGLGNTFGLAATALAWANRLEPKDSLKSECAILPELSALMRQTGRGKTSVT